MRDILEDKDLQPVKPPEPPKSEPPKPEPTQTAPPFPVAINGNAEYADTARADR